jgi:hypothetical protein
MRALGYLRRKPAVEKTETPVVEEKTNDQPSVDSSTDSATDSFDESVALG